MTTTPETPSVRDRLKARVRPTARMTICDDPTAKQALRDAEFALRAAEAAAKETGTPATRAAVKKAKAELETAQAAFTKAAIVLRFQALERRVWEALRAKHKPTEEQAEDGEMFNAETLAPELIAAASLDGITIDEAREYMTTWGTGEALTLYNTAFNVQGEIRMDVGKD